MLKISYAGCLGLCPVMSAQFTLEMCVTAWNREKFTKTYNLGVQGGSKSSMFVRRKARQQCSKSASICNRYHARPANSGKI